MSATQHLTLHVHARRLLHRVDELDSLATDLAGEIRSHRSQEVFVILPLFVQ